MFFIVQSNDSVNFPLGLIQYIVIGLIVSASAGLFWLRMIPCLFINLAYNGHPCIWWPPSIMRNMAFCWKCSCWVLPLYLSYNGMRVPAEDLAPSRIHSWWYWSCSAFLSSFLMILIMLSLSVFILDDTDHAQPFCLHSWWYWSCSAFLSSFLMILIMLNLSVLPSETWGGLVGGDRWPQEQLLAVHQAPDLAAEGQGQTGLPGALRGSAQLHGLLHERLLHGLRPGVQDQHRREGGWGKFRWLWQWQQLVREPGGSSSTTAFRIFNGPCVWSARDIKWKKTRRWKNVFCLQVWITWLAVVGGCCHIT